MSISFSTTHYVSGDEFVRVNPWFYVTLEDRFGALLSSGRFRHRVQDIQSENFPTLFNHHVASSDAFRRLFEDHRNRINAATDDGVTRLNRAAEQRVNELVNQGEQFTQLRQQIYDAAVTRSERTLADMQSKAEVAENSRTKKLTQIQESLDQVQNRQWLTFVGGALVGGLTAFALKK